MMIEKNKLLDYLNNLFPDAKTELVFKLDYELLIAVILSAQSTDKRVNQITKNLFNYNLNEISNLSLLEIENIIKSVGAYHKKATYIKSTAERLIKEKNGIVPNDRKFLESLPGVGRKTANVVLAVLHDVPAIAVDTHVSRVSKRLGIAKNTDQISTIENKLMQFIPQKYWIKFHHQMVLFGRYICKSKNPKCLECKLNNDCQYYIKKSK